MFEHGLGKAIKKSFTGEGASLTKAQGRGNYSLPIMEKEYPSLI